MKKGITALNIGVREGTALNLEVHTAATKVGNDLLLLLSCFFASMTFGRKQFGRLTIWLIDNLVN